jgi:VanZ family protein
MLRSLPNPADAPRLARVVAGAFQAALLACLVLAPTVFGGLHRYGSTGLLLLVGLVVGFWVVSSLWGPPLRYVRSAANLALWLLLLLVLAQVLPLPRGGPIGDTIRGLGLPTDLLVNGGFELPLGHRVLPVDHYSLRPDSTLGVLLAALSAASLYWTVASTILGRKAILRLMWAALVGIALLALWTVLACVRPAGSPADGVFSRLPGVPVWGGDSLVPSLLAGLPLGVMLALRPLGWLPRRSPWQRQNRWGWLVRPGFAGPLAAMLLLAGIAVALGMSHASPAVMLAAALVSITCVFLYYIHARRPRGVSAGRAAFLVLVLTVWIAGGLLAGAAVRSPAPPETSVSERVTALADAVPWPRSLFGIGAGAISSREAFGPPAGSGAPGPSHRAGGWELVRAEIGPAGLLLAAGAAAALALSIVRAGRKVRSAWPHLATGVGLGVLASSALYFAYDASALLVPNLLVLAAVLGAVTAWRTHAGHWHPAQAADLAPAHWPMVAGALVLLAAMGVADSDMVNKVGPEPWDKAMHFSGFGLLALVLAYALGPSVTLRLLKTRILAAWVIAIGLGIALEYGQRYFALGRAFEVGDMKADALGATIMVVAWWIFRRGQASAPPPEPADEAV